MPKNNTQEQRELMYSMPDRHLTVFQRIASFLSLPRNRRTTTRPRPSTAPPPRIEISSLLDDAHGPCPNDPDVYYSFPPIENMRRSSILSGISGLLSSRRPTASTSPPSRPCSSGRAGTPCTHIALPGPTRRHMSTVSMSEIRDAAERTAVRSSILDHDLDAIIRAHRATLPPCENMNPHFVGPTSSPSRPPTRRGPPADGTTLPFDRLQASMALLNNRGTPPLSPLGNPRPARTRTPGRPLDRIPPKLSYIWWLPDSHKYPYVHKREFKRYCEREIAAGRGAEIAAVMARQEPRPRTAPSAPAQSEFRDWSRTIVYKDGAPPVPIVADPNRELDLELEASGVYKRRTARARAEARRRRRHNTRCKDDESESEGPPSEHSSDRYPYGFDPPLETPSTVGGTRMEIRGGDANTPWDHDLAYGLYSYADVDCEWCACEEHVERGSSGGSGSSTSLAVSSARREVTQARQAESPLTMFNPCCGTTRGSPHLRGGAGSSADEARNYPRKLGDGDSLPSSLWRLAGGRGLPPTVKDWKKKRPERRMGGLLGLAVFGERAGLPYGLQERGHRTRPSSGVVGTRDATAASALGQGEREVHSALWGDGDRRE